MRIIAGRWRGRRLATVRGSMRPTADRVREAIFNILGDWVEGVRVLDLFAGTGALGIEALSRGARQAVFVEEDPTSLRVLRKNLANCQVGEVTQVLPMAVPMALQRLARQERQFELILLDPPYGRGLAAQTLGLLAHSKLVNAEARLVVEYGRQDQVPEVCRSLTQTDRRRYGETLIAFYTARADQFGRAEAKEPNH